MSRNPRPLDELLAAYPIEEHAASLDDIETPVPVIDVDIVERNIARWQEHCDGLGLANRPHIKTHKLILWAARQIDFGATGITCQKLGEAEVMADAGLDDILIAYNIVGGAKLRRLVALCRQARISVVADSRAVVAGLSRAIAEAGLRLRVLVECDTGGGRCGVASPEAAADLAQDIASSPGLEFAGLMTYPRPASRPQTDTFLATARSLCEARGLKVDVVSSGGTPDMWANNGLESVTEYRAGTYIYNDRSRVVRGICKLDDCALSVLVTVVSRPDDRRVIVDAGSKSLSSDLSGLEGFGMVPALPGASIPRLDEEHGYITLAAQDAAPGVGARLRIVPNHVCVVSNLVDKVALCRGDRLLGLVRVDARGLVK